MSHREGDYYLIRPTPGICGTCGRLDDVRPYGYRGAPICCECAMKDPRAQRKARRMIAASKGVILDLGSRGGGMN